MVKIFCQPKCFTILHIRKKKWSSKTVIASTLTPKTVSLSITACKVLSYCAKIMIITIFPTNSAVFNRSFLALYWKIIRIIQAQRAILCSQIWDQPKFYAIVTFVTLSCSICLLYHTHPKFKSIPGQPSLKWE